MNRLHGLSIDVIDRFDLGNAHRKMNWKEKSKIMHRIKMRNIGKLVSFVGIIFIENKVKLE
jgi:uncharacterized membrane protein